MRLRQGRRRQKFKDKKLSFFNIRKIMHQAFSDNDVGRKYTTVGSSTHCTIRTYLCLTQK